MQLKKMNVSIATFWCDVMLSSSSNFTHHTNSVQYLHVLHPHLCHHPHKGTVSHLLCDQIEFANVIVLNKCDLIDEEHKATIIELLRKFNPEATIVESTHGRVATEEILGTSFE